MNWVRSKSFLALVVCGAVEFAVPCHAAAQAGQPASDEQTRIVVPGPQYGMPDGYTLFFGKDYRDLWTTPIRVNVLDFSKTAGGLQVVRVVGGNESRGLALRGADGKDYSFRPVKKDLSGVLPIEFCREIATLLLLLGAACGAGRNGRERLGLFGYTFAVWDLTYYLYLSFWIGFPRTLGDTDIYFLVPIAWYGPVWLPVLVCMPLILAGSVRLLTGAHAETESRPSADTA